MQYQSTRGKVSKISFTDAVLMGLGTDGGLLLPETVPNVSQYLEQWQSLSYPELAKKVMALYIDDIPESELSDIIDKSYSTFTDSKVTPLKLVGDNYILELFHGPTLAFKDVALQFLGNVFEYILARTKGELNIVGATSGDTGSAAIAGVRGKENINIFIMYPNGKTSELQELQMTSVLDANVHNIAVDGSFDDCQALLKSVFSDLDFKKKYQLGAVNSVNWARILAQIVYFFSAYFQLKEFEPKLVSFDVCVPTGNFGDIFAGYLARKMGLPIDRLILATNSNDILTRFFTTGKYERGEVNFTHSPAMDIQVSSNFERYLYYALDGSSEKVREFMFSFAETGSASIPFNTPSFDQQFAAGSASNEQTLATIRQLYESEAYVADPHTAVGLHVGRQFRRPGVPVVHLATAHPAKFDSAIELALPEVHPTHATLEALKGLQTRKSSLKVDEKALKEFIVSHSHSR
ncbi:MAG: threonine synthase [Candidatus Azotimanducaceae bacterium]|jgi:threonine synthase